MLIIVFVVLISSFLLERILSAVLWRRSSRRVETILKQQGIKTPPPGWFGGNVVQLFKLRFAKRSQGMSEISHDIVPHVTPEITFWSSLYGKLHLTWWLHEPRLYLHDPESVREVLSKQNQWFVKSKTQLEFVIDFIGHGLVGVNGTEWAKHRSVLSPAFHAQKLKGMVPCVEECVGKLVDNWKHRVSNGQAEIEITKDITKLAADVISHTAFGSSYEKGGQVFQGLKLLAELLIKAYHFSWLPLFKYYPTSINRQAWKVRRHIDDILQGLIRERRKSGVHGKDLLGLMLEESEKAGDFTDSTLVDECKTFYLAGHETTAALMGWTLLLLAINPEWQERARAEVEEHCMDGFGPDGEALNKLKVVGMILHETLRLYPAAVEIHRAAAQDTVINGLRIPKGTGVAIPILSLHHDPELWGSDVNEFNPQRFEQGVSKASKHPNAFMPFSFGPRVCIGQAYALNEAKIALAMLLRSFSFKVSPGYRHNPTVKIVVIPEHGIQLLVEELNIGK